MSNPTLASLLYTGFNSPVFAHLETCNSPAHHRPIVASRSNGFDQSNPFDVANDCANANNLGFGFSPNTYKVGSFENKCLLNYLPVMSQLGMPLMINIDKGVYQNTASEIDAIRAYILWLRANAFGKNYFKWQGKYVITYFCSGNEDVGMFIKIENDNPDIAFVYNDNNVIKQIEIHRPNVPVNTMSWVTEGLTSSLEEWCKTYSNAPGLHIPHICPGFNDSVVRFVVPTTGMIGPYKSNVSGYSTATSPWTNSDGSYSPARIWNSPKGYGLPTLMEHAAVLNRYYSATHPMPALQIVTWDDLDEGTGIQPKKDGTGGFFSVPPPPPPPVVVTHGELWVNGVKLGEYSSGTHKVTTQQCMSDGSLQNIVNTTFTV